MFKRGFLNTDKARRALTPDAPRDSSIHKDKGKAREESPPLGCEPHPRPPVPSLDLHSVPSSIKTAKDRFIFRHWPRDPNGKTMRPSTIRGKEAGNGLDLWGATLYDFYHVHRIPPGIEKDAVHLLTISTGSKLATVMKAFGELDHAKDEIEWASREADPAEIAPWNPAAAVVAHEHRVHASSGTPMNMEKPTSPKVPLTEVEDDIQPLGTSDTVTYSTGPKEDAAEVAEDLTSEEGENESEGLSTPTDDVGTHQPLLDIPLESPFHPSHYPAPWPLVPFEDPYSPFILHRAIPIHLLPKKLHVHDPWGLLRAGRISPNTLEKAKKESWSSKTDCVHTYTLSLPPESQRAEAASKAAAAAKDDAPDIPETISIYPRETEGPTKQPLFRAVLPQRPRKPTEVPEAHLYLSPKGSLGTGNHSIVYEAELELPRDLFCESTYCETCLHEQIQIIINQLRESEEWERGMNEAAERYQQTIAPRVTSTSIQTPARYVGFVEVTLEHAPVDILFEVSSAEETPPADAPAQYARVPDQKINRQFGYKGLVVEVNPNIKWQNPSFPDTICKHQAENKNPVPRTATFRVAAKLSLPNDRHLEREANNYLKFPAHFFQHWSGYNIVPPIHDPTPVGALVPQFFGYYTPDTLSQSNGKAEYRSPILLLEHCGQPICAQDLSMDDRQECGSLLFRFHSGGWLHHSFAERNILMQKYHPTCGPLEDEEKCAVHRHRPYSFRMIDFGRSVECETGSQRAQEEMAANLLFGINGFEVIS